MARAILWRLFNINKISVLFEFREIEFDGKNKPKISEANPQKCIQCHQSPQRKNIDMRPNWEPYAIWPGVYGSDDGLVGYTPLKKKMYGSDKEKFRPQDEEFILLQAQEETLLNNFVAGAADHPRYSLLGRLNLHAPVELTEHFAILNMFRVFRLMQEQKEIYTNYREMIASVDICQSNKVTQNEFMEWHKQQPIKEYAHYESETTISNFLTRLFEPLGIDTSDWSMDFGTRGRMAFRERFGTPSPISGIFNYVLKNQEPEFAENINCAQLKKTYEEKLTRFFTEKEHLRLQTENAPPKPTPENIVARCMKCHESYETFAPGIPFVNPSLLVQKGFLEKIEFRTSDMAGFTQQMPPNQRLSPEERDVLLNYLQKFAH